MYSFGAALVEVLIIEAEKRTGNRMIQEIATRMIQHHIPFEGIAEYLDISIQKVEEIAAELKDD